MLLKWLFANFRGLIKWDKTTCVCPDCDCGNSWHLHWFLTTVRANGTFVLVNENGSGLNGNLDTYMDRLVFNVPQVYFKFNAKVNIPLLHINQLF